MSMLANELCYAIALFYEYTQPTHPSIRVPHLDQFVGLSCSKFIETDVIALFIVRFKWFEA